MRIALVTSNLGKLREVRSALEPLSVEVEHCTEDCDEIQADTLQEVVQNCLVQLKAKGLDNFVIDDSGLFIDRLKGFPGVYSAYALRTLGIDGVLKLLDGLGDRNAHFECCIGAIIEGREIVVSARCDGAIALGASGSGGFGFDPIFIPSGYDRTFSEISIEEKNRISHRGKAVQAFSAELGRIIHGT